MPADFATTKHPTHPPLFPFQAGSHQCETLLPQERALIEAFRKLSTKRKYDVINIVEGFALAESGLQKSKWVLSM